MALTVDTRDRPDTRLSGVIGAGVGSAALFSVALVAPLLGFVSIVSPFPLIVQRLRGGVGAAVLAALVAGALLAGFFSAGLAVAFSIVLILPGLIIGDVLARGRGLPRGCAWAFVWLASLVTLALLLAGPQMAARLVEPFEQYRSPQFLEEMRSSGLPAERVDDWAEQFSSWQRMLAIVYPAAYLIMAGVIVLANAALLRAYLAWKDPGWLEGGEFEGIRWPFLFAVFFVLSGAMVVSPPLRPVAYNTLLVLAFFFALQGLAVVAYYAHRLAGPPVLRTAVVVLVLVNPWAPQILALLGLFDLWFDFRKWADPPKAKEG
jgi:MFS family permease